MDDFSDIGRFEAILGGALSLRRVRPELPAPIVGDRYEVRAILGTGGFGTVLKAWDPKLERDVAIKCVPTDDPVRGQAAISAEARALARVEAPEVVDVYDWDATHVRAGRRELPCVAIVMACVAGQNLRDWMRRQRSKDKRLAVLLSAAKGLEAAHAVGVVHRDFKPENVMVTTDDQARVVDFGLAYRASHASSSKQLAPRGLVGIGTPEYMAPEALRGEVTHASDQFSYAVTAWELLTGRRPFEFIERLDRHLDKTLRRALSASADARFPTLTALRREIEEPGARGPRLAVLAAGTALGVTAAALIAKKHLHDDDD
jgi:serine/threonine protein kinase